MKRVICTVTIAFALFNVCIAQSNVYRKFPDSVAVWNWTGAQGCITWPTFYDYSFVMDGDTTIGNYIYNKVTLPFYHAYGNEICPFYYNTGMWFGVREDTASRKVYIWTGAEYLLYDFTLQVGDTVYSHLSPWGCAIVTAIDSVQCNDGWRRRFVYTSDAGNKDIIEGIGSINGLIENLCLIVGSHGVSLNCFSNNGQPIYPYSFTNCSIVEIPEFSMLHRPADVFPNPIQELGSFSVQLDSYEPGMSFVIYNTVGRKILSNFLTSAKTTLFPDGIERGLYFYKILSPVSSTLYSGKLIVR